MNCGKVQKLIITDYSDGELSPRLQGEIENHLKVCSQCRQYERLMRQVAIEPFKKTTTVKPPERVWKHIKSSIENEQTIFGLAHVAHTMRNLFHVWKPVFAIVAVIVFILVTLVVKRIPFNGQDEVTVHLAQQMEFLTDLGNEAENGYFYTEYPDLVATVEEYFL